MMKNQLIGYTTIGTNDLDRAKEFYNNLFSEIGAVGFAANDRVFLWRVDGGSSMFAVAKPYDEKEATVGNGKHGRSAIDTPQKNSIISSKTNSPNLTE
jgi:catechol 2,3-dioxygenase-like lactoylglutathione lyase family enzyme